MKLFTEAQPPAASCERLSAERSEFARLLQAERANSLRAIGFAYIGIVIAFLVLVNTGALQQW